MVRDIRSNINILCCYVLHMCASVCVGVYPPPSLKEEPALTV